MTINHVLIIKALIISYINASLLLNYQYLCQCQYFSMQLGQVTFELASWDLVDPWSRASPTPRPRPGLGLDTGLGLDLVSSSQPKLLLFS